MTVRLGMEQMNEGKKVSKASARHQVFWETISKLVKSQVAALQKKKLPHLEAWERYDRILADGVKKHYSSTHTWVPGKSRWSKKRDNFWVFPLECSVCRMGAAKHDQIGAKLVPTEVPSRDMHLCYIDRTCEEVMNTWRLASKKRGPRCIQCYTYGCDHS